MRRPLALPLLVAAALLLSGRPALSVSGFPQLKINYIDVSEAPTIRIYASILDGRLRAIDTEKYLDELEVLRKRGKEKAEELFAFVKNKEKEEIEVSFPKSDGDDDEAADEKSEDELPTFHLMADDEGGMAAVVVMPGYASEEYSAGTVGERMRSGAALFFKQLGKANLMNVVWYSDTVYAYVNAKGKTGELSRLDRYLPKCEAWAEKQLESEEEEGEGDEEEEGEDGPKLQPDEAHCGLTDDYAKIGKMVKHSPTGAFPKLFGLGAKPCTKPKRTSFNTEMPGSDDLFDDGEQTKADAAFDAALRMLVEGAKPGQPRVLILLGDGRDGYMYRLDECRAHFQTTCNQKELDARKADRRHRYSYKRVRQCVDTDMKKVVADEQSRFAARVERWIGIAKAAGIRVMAVANPTAETYERKRMEVLAWRTGGTMRAAEDDEGVIDQYTHVIDELNNQLVITFTDEQATPGSSFAYQLDAKLARGDVEPTEPITVEIPKKPEGMAVMIANVRALGMAKLGKWGMLAIVAAIALILLLILFKIFKKILGKGAKGAKGAAGKAKKGAKAAKGAKGLKKAGKLAVKAKK